MNNNEIKSLLNRFTSFSINDKKEFIESLADIGGFEIDIKPLIIDSKVNYRKTKDGEYKAKIDIPIEWLISLGITRDDNDITLKLIDNEISINKHELEYLNEDDCEEYEIDYGYEEESSKDKIHRILKQTTARQLIEDGKLKGYLTLSEVMEAFSEVELDKEQIANLYETLNNIGIQLIESNEDLEGVYFEYEEYLDSEEDFDL